MDRRQSPISRKGSLRATCNRTELYFAASNPETAGEGWLRRLGELRRGWSVEGATGRYRRCGESAMLHLLRVASGLDSSVLGDVQILGQIKRAVAASRVESRLGKTLSTAFEAALAAGRRARIETSIRRGQASVGAAVVSTLDELAPGETGLRICLIGAGSIAQKFLRQLSRDEKTASPS